LLFGWQLSVSHCILINHFISSCLHPEYAVRFIDYFYSEEGAMLANYGIEGITYEIINGKPMQTELITKNPDGLTTTMAQARYLIHNGFMVFLLGREEDVQSQTALEYRDLWSPTGEWNIVGNISYITEEGTERSILLNDISTYVNEMTVKFIMGVTDLNDTTWNEYVKRLQSMKVDRVVELTQKAYNRYQSR
jgi:putative aldouronate transport system substrate-binding protein